MMLNKSVIIDNIPYNNFTKFNISIFFLDLFCNNGGGGVLYTRATYIPSNTVIIYESASSNVFCH